MTAISNLKSIEEIPDRSVHRRSGQRVLPNGDEDESRFITDSEMNKSLNGANDCSGIWSPKSGATVSVLQKLSEESPIQFPASFLDFLTRSNGGEGELSIDPGWVVFWPAEEIREYNVRYGVDVALPGFWGFASNGGGELLAFDARNASPFPIAMIPFIPLHVENAVVIACDIDTFLAAVGRHKL